MSRFYASLGMAAALGGVLLLAGCGDPDGGSASQAPATPAAASQDAGSGGATNGGAGNGASGGQGAGATNPSGGYWPATVQLGHNDGLGSTVVDGEGRTLYRFDPDSAHPSKATCVDACAVTWPPVLVNDEITFKGLDSTTISAVVRPDGTHQLTIGGWPVYKFSKDTAAGDTKGEGVGGTWFAVAPDGTKAKDSKD